MNMKANNKCYDSFCMKTAIDQMIQLEISIFKLLYDKQENRLHTQSDRMHV